MRMNRLHKIPQKIVIGIIIAMILASVVIMSVRSFKAPDDAIEVRAEETVEESKAPAEKNTSKKVEIKTSNDDTIEQKTSTSKISASKQSSLELAIDDLIKLTESEE